MRSTASILRLREALPFDVARVRHGQQRKHIEAQGLLDVVLARAARHGADRSADWAGGPPVPDRPRKFPVPRTSACSIAIVEQRDLHGVFGRQGMRQKRGNLGVGLRSFLSSARPLDIAWPHAGERRPQRHRSRRPGRSRRSRRCRARPASSTEEMRIAYRPPLDLGEIGGAAAPRISCETRRGGRSRRSRATLRRRPERRQGSLEHSPRAAQSSETASRQSPRHNMCRNDGAARRRPAPSPGRWRSGECAAAVPA